MSDYTSNDGTTPIGEGDPIYAPTPTADQDAPAPVGQDNTPEPDEDPTTPAPGDEGGDPAPAGVATRDGQIVDKYPVTQEAIAEVKARRDQAAGTTTTDADVTQA